MRDAAILAWLNSVEVSDTSNKAWSKKRKRQSLPEISLTPPKSEDVPAMSRQNKRRATSDAVANSDADDDDSGHISGIPSRLIRTTRSRSSLASSRTSSMPPPPSRGSSGFQSPVRQGRLALRDPNGFEIMVVRKSDAPGTPEPLANFWKDLIKINDGKNIIPLTLRNQVTISNIHLSLVLTQHLTTA